MMKLEAITRKLERRTESSAAVAATLILLNSNLPDLGKRMLESTSEWIVRDVREYGESIDFTLADYRGTFEYRVSVEEEDGEVFTTVS